MSKLAASFAWIIVVMLATGCSTTSTRLAEGVDSAIADIFSAPMALADIERFLEEKGDTFKDGDDFVYAEIDVNTDRAQSLLSKAFPAACNLERSQARLRKGDYVSPAPKNGHAYLQGTGGTIIDYKEQISARLSTLTNEIPPSDVMWKTFVCRDYVHRHDVNPFHTILSPHFTSSINCQQDRCHVLIVKGDVLEIIPMALAKYGYQQYLKAITTASVR